MRRSSRPPTRRSASSSIERKVVELPLNGRNFTQLGTLLPGVVAPPCGARRRRPAKRRPAGSAPPPPGSASTGMRNQSNNFLLDGASNNDTFNTGFVLRPPPDAIQEFKILTHSYTAEYGRNSGSVVNVVTQAGTNDVARRAPGSSTATMRCRRGTSSRPQTQAKPKLKQNQFGGSLGGPVVQNRLFGFGYYEGFRNTSGNTQNFVVLSDAQRQRRFRRHDDPRSADRPAVPEQPDSGEPHRSGRAEAHQRVRAARQQRRQPLHRVAGHHRRSRPVRHALRLPALRRATRCSSATSAARPSVSIRRPRRPIGTLAKATLQDIMVADTHVFSANLINVARFSYNRIGASPQGTSGLANATTASTCRRTSESARGLANITHHRLLQRSATCSSRSSSASTRCSSSPTTSPGCAAAHSLKFGGECAARAHGHRVREPARTATTRSPATPARPATPRPISCSGCRRSSAGRRRTRRRTASAGSTRATRRTSSGRGTNVTINVGAALRAAAAVRRRERRAQLVPSRSAVDAVPARAAGPRLSG